MARRKKSSGKCNKSAGDSKVDHQNKKQKKFHLRKQDKKLAGLIFMCDSKTKESCFMHKVFGSPAKKKKVVKKVKPGMKLFLFDSDLRMVYGVYRASSAGALNLEPLASGLGKKAFSAQVRFRIDKECLPLPENTFKKAIKDNYDNNNKRFKFELNARQVKKLSQLFHAVRVDGSPVRVDLHLQNMGGFLPPKYGHGLMGGVRPGELYPQEKQFRELLREEMRKKVLQEREMELLQYGGGREMATLTTLNPQLGTQSSYPCDITCQNKLSEEQQLPASLGFLRLDYHKRFGNSNMDSISQQRLDPGYFTMGSSSTI